MENRFRRDFPGGPTTDGYKLKQSAKGCQVKLAKSGSKIRQPFADSSRIHHNDSHAEQIVRDLAVSGFRIETMLEQTVHDRIVTVRLSKGSTRNIVVDLLFASSGIEQEIAAEGEVVEIFDEVQLTIASLSGLIALKVLSADADNRPQDEIDLNHLLNEADSTELKRAEELLELIEKRGYNRGKYLLLDLIKYQKRFLN